MDWLAPFSLSAQSAYDAVVSAVVLYVFIVGAVRLLGVRSISSLNNFDWVVLVVIGAIAGTAIVSPGVSVANAMVGIGALFALQYAVTWTFAHFPGVADTLGADKAVLVRDGEVDADKLREARITRAEIMAQVRNQGFLDLDDVDVVVLETDAQMSVVPKSKV